MSNQRQTVMSMLAYQNDSEGFWPMYYFWAPHFSASVANQPWGTALWRLGYLQGAPDLLTCPSFDGGKPSVASGDNLAWAHYGYNYMNLGSGIRSWGNGAGSPWKHAPAHGSDIRKPGETYALMDAFDVTKDQQGIYVVEDTQNRFMPHARHSSQSQINLMWADGHGSSVRIADAAQPYIELGSYSTTDENFWDLK
jgi:prepilin-type processing-associated H-X9-DG protein